MRRDVTRVVTPGTLTDDALLDPRESNYLAVLTVDRSARAGGEARVGLAWIELSLGRFLAAIVPCARLLDELSRIQPAECLVGEDVDLPELGRAGSMMVTRRPPWEFGHDTAQQILQQHFGVTTLEGFGFQADDSLAVRAAGAVISYLRETQKSSLEHIDRLLPYRSGHCLEIDQATRRSLEITRTLREDRREGSLLAVIDRTVTAMGSRLLADWIANPLTQVAEIEQRLDVVEELLDEPALCRDLQSELRGIYDLQRLLARVATGRTNPRDLSFLARTLQALPGIRQRLESSRADLLQRLWTNLDPCPELRDELLAALQDECPLSTREGGFIRPGFSPALDELRQLASGGKEWIAQYQARQLQESGIPSLKVGYNKVFGYYIEVTNTHRDKIPASYIRKQTIKNAERYITPELKEYEEKVLSADEKSQELEFELFVQLKDRVQSFARRLVATADVLAQLDVLIGLAELARATPIAVPS